MGNTRPIPLDVMERIERLERHRWRPDVATATNSEAEQQRVMMSDVSKRLDAIERRLSDLEGNP